MKPALKWVARRMGVTRANAAAARMRLEREWLALSPRRDERPGGRVLCYHSVGQPQSGVNDVTPAQFKAQIETALALGYRFVPARHIAETGGAANDLAITFDDAWSSVLHVAGPILKSYQIPWTVFAVSSWCDHRDEWTSANILSWGELGRVTEFGGEIGSHSVSHPDFAKLNPDQVVEELEASRDAIATKLGFTPTLFAIPYGQSMNWSPACDRAARAAGYDLIFAQAEETRPPGSIGRTFITHYDAPRLFRAALSGAYDRWEEWV